MACEIPLRSLLRQQEEDEKIGRRVAPRRSVAGPAAVQIGPRRFLAGLRDISVGGTCVDIDVPCEQWGSVIVSIGHLTLDAKIVRRSGCSIGIQFTRPLSEQTLTELVGQFEPLGQNQLDSTSVMEVSKLELIVSNFANSLDQTA